MYMGQGVFLSRRNVLLLCCAALLTVTLIVGLSVRGISYAAGSAYVRVNQVGYITGETKQAMMLASGSESGATFSVVNASGQTIYKASVGSSRGKWSSAFPDSYLLDFSCVKAVGSYSIHVSGAISATSPTFKIDSGANLYTQLLSNAEFFYQAQRDGADVNSSVMNRQPSHLTDKAAYIYNTPSYSNDVLQGSLQKIGGPIDVSGGWFDAGDYVKFVETASYTDAIMLFAARQYPDLLTSGLANFSAEGRYGLDWLQKMWDNSTETLYYQVGIGDGNGSSILADHDFWRLPQADDQLNAKPGDSDYYLAQSLRCQRPGALRTLSCHCSGGQSGRVSGFASRFAE